MDDTRDSGEQCEGTTKAGERCQARAFAHVAIYNREGGHIRSAWLCAMHQRTSLPPGGVVSLLRKWERPKEDKL